MLIIYGKRGGVCPDKYHAANLNKWITNRYEKSDNLKCLKFR